MPKSLEPQPPSSSIGLFQRLVAWHSRAPWQVHLSLAAFLLVFISSSILLTKGGAHAQLSPSVVITAPSDGSTISGTSVAMSASASGGTTTTALDLIFSDVSSTTISATSTDAGATWTATLDSTTFADGATTLFASSTIDGASVTSMVINLTIHNAPVVTITSPTDSSTVSGASVPLAATISAGVSTTASALNFVFSDTSGTTISATSTNGVSWTATLDSTSFQDGATTLIASSTINGTNVASTVINLTVNNAPTITLTAPANGATISGSNVLLSATTTNGLATAVEFDLGGVTSTQLDATNTTPDAPWTAHLDSTSFGDGALTIVASSTMNGVNVTSSLVSVNVSNNGGGGGSGGGIATVKILSPADGEVVTGTVRTVVQVVNGSATAVSVALVGNSGGSDLVEGPSGIWTDSQTADSAFFPAGPYSIVASAIINSAPVNSAISTFTTPSLSSLPPGIRMADVGSGNALFTYAALGAVVTGGEPDAPVTFTINGVPYNGGILNSQVSEIPNFPGIWEVNILSQDFPIGDLSIVANATIQGVAYQTSPLILHNRGIPQGKITQPIDCTQVAKGVVTLSSQAESDLGRLEYDIYYAFPNNQLPTDENFAETADPVILPAQYNAVHGTWDASWDTNSLGSGTYQISSIGKGSLNDGYFDFGHVSVGVGNPCYFLTPAGAQAPRFDFQSPLTNAVVSGTVPLVVSAPVAVKAGFDILANAGGTPFHLDATQTDATWIAQWDTTHAPNGSYTVTPSAETLAGVDFTGDAHVLNVVNVGGMMATSTAATSTLDMTISTDLTPPPALSFDPTATGTYSADIAFALNPSIDADLSIAAASSSPLCAPGSLIKLPNDRNPKTMADAIVYYCAQDGQRYIFPNAKTYFSWYSDFSSVTIVDLDTMNAIPVGGFVHYRPGSRMVKVPSDPKVYAVARGGALRWITSEAIAVQLYGADWNTKIDDLSDDLFASYQSGPPIGE